ncbi:MAG: iron-sulfur cluster assembly scaffold protein, partial [Calditrichaeota bacterium]
MDQKRVPLLKDMGYSDKGIRLIMNQINMGTMQDSSVTAKEEGTCGDVLILHLKISDDIIMDAAYEYIGCAGLQATASALTEMI